MRTNARYWELVLAVPPDAAEGLTNFLWESGALGVVEEERPGSPPELRAFFPETAPAALLEARVSAYAEGLATLGFGAVGRPRVIALEDTGWAEAWREHFRPITIGRFVVTPPWETPDADGRLVLVIEPGRAFGTGHHGSTAGCLQAIDGAVGALAPTCALDLGTGSGILAIALARLGVRRVIAVDEDPDAIAATTANAARNGVAAAVDARVADVATVELARAPLVVANLVTAAHRRLGGRYAATVAGAGRLILGGVLDAETTGIEATMRYQGFVPDGVIRREGWSTLTFVNAGGDATLHDRA